MLRADAFSWRAPDEQACGSNYYNRGKGEKASSQRVIARAFSLLAQAASSHEIADRLVISLKTVKKHVGNLLLKLAAQNRTQAVAHARELSLL